MIGLSLKSCNLESTSQKAILSNAKKRLSDEWVNNHTTSENTTGNIQVLFNCPLHQGDRVMREYDRERVRVREHARNPSICTPYFFGRWFDWPTLPRRTYSKLCEGRKLTLFAGRRVVTEPGTQELFIKNYFVVTILENSLALFSNTGQFHGKAIVLLGINLEGMLA